MTTEFVAFDVKEGNCFLLQRALDDGKMFRALVDAGRNTRQVAKFLTHHLGLGSLSAGKPAGVFMDVVVLTHTDADHLGGLRAVLDLPMQIGELWLPDRWSRTAALILRDPNRFVRGAAALIATIPEGTLDTTLSNVEADLDEEVARDWTSLGEAILDRLPFPSREGMDEVRQETASDAGQSERLEDLSLKALGRILAAHQPSDAPHLMTLAVEWWWESWPWNRPLRRASLLPALFHGEVWSPREVLRYGRSEDRRDVARFAILAALCGKGEQVKDAAVAAYRKKIHLRWFAYQDAPKKTVAHPHLHVLNAVELTHIPGQMNPEDYLFFAKDSSVTNHESLVLHAPAKEGQPAVLFSADSDFRFAEHHPSAITWSPGMIVTAAHHGSANNDGVAHLYRKAQATDPSLSSVWVRSDKAQPKSLPERPAGWYTTLDSSSGVWRYCTCCAGQQKDSQQPRHVRLTVHNSRWRADPAVPPCTCAQVVPPR